MKYFYRIKELAILLTLLLLGCQASHDCSIYETGIHFIAEINIPQAQLYDIASPIIRNGEFVGFVGYNNANHSIDVFENNQLVNSIKLTFEGPGSIDEIRGVQEYSAGEFILISRYIARTIRSNGQVLKEVNISTNENNTMSGMDMDKYHPSVSPNSGLDFYYDDSSAELFVPLNNFSYPEWTSIEAYQPGERFAGVVNLETGASRFIDVDYPDFIANNLYGMLAGVNVTFDGNGNMIYGFDGFPDIYIFNLKTKSLKHEPNRQGGEEIPPLTNLDDLSGYSNGKNFYERILYNPLDKKLYQIIMKVESGGNYGAYLRKMDKDGVIEGEGKVRRGLHVMSILCTDSGVFCQDMMAGEDFIRYVNIDFDCAEK